MRRFYDILPSILARKEPFALGIISGIKGSSPQKQGAKAIFLADGTIEGTLGGGCLEAEIQDRARRALLTRTPATFDLVLDHDFGWDDGLICGGKVSGVILPNAASAAAIWNQLSDCTTAITWGVRHDFTIALVTDPAATAGWLYQETVTPRSALWIAGSGHVAQAVAPLALQLDFAVTVFDDRPGLANTRYFPSETKFRVGYWEELLREPLPATPTYGLIVTRGHQRDALALRSWIQHPFTFLGMIGSKRKRRLIFEEFMAEGIASEAQLSRVVCPVGIDIQSKSVNEIAVSIAAQLIQVRAAQAGPPPGPATERGYGQRNQTKPTGRTEPVS